MAMAFKSLNEQYDFLAYEFQKAGGVVTTYFGGYSYIWPLAFFLIGAFLVVLAYVSLRLYGGQNK
jgi:hypothetical protein